MLALEFLAQRKIEEAIARGEFDDLPGAGRPLELDDDPLVPEELRVAYRILKNAGYVPPEVQALNEIAKRRGQTLAQMAIVWALRDHRVTSALLGASSVKQLEQNVAALERPDFEESELEEIDRYAVEGGINLWEVSSSA